MVIVGWPTVHGWCCMVSATAPGTVCVPPMPMPIPPVVGVSGTFTAEMHAGPKIRQTFTRPERPMGLADGGPAERPVAVPVRFAMPDIRSDWMVALDVTGSDVLIGPNCPPLNKMVEM